MNTTSESSTTTSPVVDEEDLWGTKSIYSEDASPSTEISLPGFHLGMSPPLSSPTHIYLLAAPESRRMRVPRPTPKPKGPRPQPPKHVVESPELQAEHSSNHYESSISATRSTHRARGIYGDRPRLPTHRPSCYISKYTCDGDRFAHLTPLRNQQTLVVDQHACVNLATMGLERFNMGDENECMDLEEETEFFRSLDVAIQQPSVPLSHSSLQLGFVANGLRGALSNFRTRFGLGPGAARGCSGERESGVEMLVEGSYVDVGRDGVCSS